MGRLAALLAAEGMTTSADAVFGRIGMLSTYFGDEHLGTSWLLKPEGVWTVTDPGLNIKRYASCALTHRCIDAALALRAEHAIAPDTIDSVVCFCPPRASEVLRYRTAADGLEARFCMPFAVVSALIHGDVGPRELDVAGFATVVV
jgi:2-methylcitrate dehydratase PrpD